VARRALAFGMNVIAVTRHPERKVSEIPSTAKAVNGSESQKSIDSRTNTNIIDVVGRDELENSLSKSDYVSLHTDLTAETQGMIAKREFAKMRSGAFLINVARASIVDRRALFESLTEGKIAGAAFDVFWEEPADPNDPLLQLDNFVLTPHIAGWTRESTRHAAELITKNIEMVSRGISPVNSVNTI
jgi:D-3-phosphoglycerate dehydrogenase